MIERDGHLYAQVRLRTVRLTYSPGSGPVREFRTLASGGADVDRAIEALVADGTLVRVDPRLPRWSRVAVQKLRITKGMET